MNNNPSLWVVRHLPDGLTLKPRAGYDLALVLAQDEKQVRVDLANVKALVAALVDGAPNRFRLGTQVDRPKWFGLPIARWR